MAPAALLDPKPGERVLDLCAAPGGKSTQLAGKMQGSGLLVCNEINSKRAKILASNIERLGIANALVLNEHPQRLEARFEGFFDKILVFRPHFGGRTLLRRGHVPKGGGRRHGLVGRNGLYVRAAAGGNSAFCRPHAPPGR